jgi:hypothetical protein
VLLVLWLLGVVAFLCLSWTMGFRIGREVAQYMTDALALRPQRVRAVGAVLGFAFGWGMWLPLTIFNVLVFKTPYPVTGRGLRARRL